MQLISSYYSISFVSSSGTYRILGNVSNEVIHTKSLDLYFSTFWEKTRTLREHRYMRAPQSACVEGRWQPFAEMPGDSFLYGADAPHYYIEVQSFRPPLKQKGPSSIGARSCTYYYPDGRMQSRFIIVNQKNTSHRRRECMKDEVRNWPYYC